MASGLGKPLDGVLQSYRVFPTTGLVRCPEYLTDEEASCLPIAAVTAWMAIFGMEPFGTWKESQEGGKKKPLEGKFVLLEGTGGVAVAGLQIAKAAGATTIVTSSSDEKLKRAKEELGADFVINYKTTPNWEEKVMEITKANDGADIILETGGAGTLYKALDCIAFGGLISCIGYTSGKEDEEGSRMNLNLLALRRNVTLKGIINGPRDRFEEMCEFYERHQIRPVVDKVFGFEQGGEAIKYLRSGSHFGKVVVKVQ